MVTEILPRHAASTAARLLSDLLLHWLSIGRPWPYPASRSIPSFPGHIPVSSVSTSLSTKVREASQRPSTCAACALGPAACELTSSAHILAFVGASPKGWRPYGRHKKSTRRCFRQISGRSNVGKPAVWVFGFAPLDVVKCAAKFQRGFTDTAVAYFELLVVVDQGANGC